MLTRLQAGVEQGPQLGALGLRLPLAEAVTVGEDALLGTGLFLVAAGATDQGVEAELVDGFHQGDRLVHVARFAGVGQAHGAALHGVFHAAHDQFGAKFAGALVAEVGYLREVVPGVDHQQRVGDPAPAEGLLGAFEQHQRILAAREEKRGPLEGGSDLSQDEDGFFFQGVQVLVARGLEPMRLGASVHAGAPSVVFTCRPHSLRLLVSHHQRPARKSSPRLMARVQGAQPTLG